MPAVREHVVLSLLLVAVAASTPVVPTAVVPAGDSGALPPAVAPAAATGAPAPPSAAALRAYLHNITEWIMTLDVGSNVINVNHTVDPNGPSHIFINGNLARVLLAAHKLAPNPVYLAEGLRWCRTFTALQLPITTSTGEPAGFWDTGYSQVYIADTGTAIVALALCHELETSSAHAAAHLAAMHKFERFVRHGCRVAPPIGSANASGACPPRGEGWVIGATTPGAAPSERGALGDGWYKDTLNTKPYTISTATLGSCGLVELDTVAPGDDPELEPIARDAAAWLVANRTADGRIPYTITPAEHSPTTYQPITYSAESFVDVDLRYAGALQDSLAPLRSTCDWLVANQSADGSWGVFGTTASSSSSSSSSSPTQQLGFTASGDAQRSPRALTLLQWCFQRLTPADPAHGAAASKYASFLLQPANSVAFGVNMLSLPTGFVGLAVADLIQPWVTFRTAASSGTHYELGPHPLGFINASNSS